MSISVKRARRVDSVPFPGQSDPKSDRKSDYDAYDQRKDPVPPFPPLDLPRGQRCLRDDFGSLCKILKVCLLLGGLDS